MARPKRITRAEQYVLLQRDHEELEAKALSQEATIAFLNKENTTLIGTNQELQKRISSLEQSLVKARAIAMEALTEAERIKAERTPVVDASESIEIQSGEERL
jgi:predicted  nucleic acid-binding Zn-ribbon protein